MIKGAGSQTRNFSQLFGENSGLFVLKKPRYSSIMKVFISNGGLNNSIQKTFAYLRWTMASLSALDCETNRQYSKRCFQNYLF